jgi:hypothetical protein
MAETFFATLEKELLSQGPFKSQAKARTVARQLREETHHPATYYAKLTNGPQTGSKSTNVRRSTPLKA